MPGGQLSYWFYRQFYALAVSQGWAEKRDELSFGDFWYYIGLPVVIFLAVSYFVLVNLVAHRPDEAKTE